MSNIEKFIIAVIIMSLILFFVSIGASMYLISEAGGFKEVIIEAGREIKDISEQINSEPNEKPSS